MSFSLYEYHNHLTNRDWSKRKFKLIFFWECEMRGEWKVFLSFYDKWKSFNIFSLFLLSQISSVNSFDYHTATMLGLMPAQAINAYLGSKLRSIHDVINDNHTALAGYGMFIFEVSAILCALWPYWAI